MQKEPSARSTVLMFAAVVFGLLIYPLFRHIEIGEIPQYAIVGGVAGYLMVTVLCVNAIFRKIEEAPAFMEVLEYCFVTGLLAFACTFPAAATKVTLTFVRHIVLLGCLLGIVMGTALANAKNGRGFFDYTAGWYNIWAVIRMVATAAFMLVIAGILEPYKDALVRTTVSRDYALATLAGPYAMLSFDFTAVAMGNFMFLVIPWMLALAIAKLARNIVVDRCRNAALATAPKADASKAGTLNAC